MKTKMVLYLRCALLAIALVSGLPCGLNARASQNTPQTLSPGEKATESKIEELLQQSGYDYKKATNAVWYMDRQGKDMPQIRVIIASGSGFLVLGVIVAQKKDLRVTSDSMLKMLRMAHKLDYVKVGIDDDGDLFVRSETKTKLLDLQEFKDSVERIVSAADQVYAEVKPFTGTS